MNLFPDDDEVSCRKCAFGDAIVLQIPVSLAPFFVEDAQEFSLVGNQWMDGIMVVGCIGTLETVHKGWSCLRVKWERECSSNGSYGSWDVSSIDGAGIPSIECKCHALFPLEERSRFRGVDLLDSVEVPVEAFVAHRLVVLARDHFHMNAQILKGFGENTAELAVGVHNDDAW